MNLLRRYWQPWAGKTDPDSLWFPTPAMDVGEQPIVLYRNLQDRSFRKELWKATLREEIGSAPLPLGPGTVFHYLGRDWPCMIGAVAPTPVAVTPTGLGATTARLFPFKIEQGLLVAQIYMHTSGAVASSMQLGMFGSDGVGQYNSGTQGTSANVTVINVTDFIVGGGQQWYWGITNANLVSASNAYYFSPVFAAASLEYWGTVSATNGAMPATIAPGSITKTTGGFPIYTAFAAK